MKVLIACEFSGVVRDAFADRGHDSWSCDLLADESRSPKHIQGDVQSTFSGGFNILNWKWNFVGAHPPCDHLAVSGARWFPAKRADGRQKQGVDFFESHPEVKGYIENPIGIMSSHYRKPDQIIQPWLFGHPEFKATCLWLFNLQPLVPTDILTPPLKGTPEHAQWSKVHRASPGPNRWKERSRSYPGIAAAMAEQWG